MKLKVAAVIFCLVAAVGAHAAELTIEWTAHYDTESTLQSSDSSGVTVISSDEEVVGRGPHVELGRFGHTGAMLSTPVAGAPYGFPYCDGPDNFGSFTDGHGSPQIVICGIAYDSLPTHLTWSEPDINFVTAYYPFDIYSMLPQAESIHAYANADNPDNNERRTAHWTITLDSFTIVPEPFHGPLFAACVGAAGFCFCARTRGRL